MRLCRSLHTALRPTPTFIVIGHRTHTISVSPRLCVNLGQYECTMIQECIPVGCVPPAAVAVRGGLHQTPPPGSRPPSLWTESQTGVKILPCPKLRLWAVNIWTIHKTWSPPSPCPRTSQIWWGVAVQTFSDGVHLDAVLVLLHDGLHLVQVEEARPVIVPHLEQTVEQRLPPRRQHLLAGLRGQRFV